MDIADLVSTWSKDRSTKVGCVVVGDAGQILATGYNGFPRGIDDDMDSRHERPMKYMITEHAERNAIYNAARSGLSLVGSTLYVGWQPCADCSRGVIQSGISHVCMRTGVIPERWLESCAIGRAMLMEAGVSVRWLD